MLIDILIYFYIIYDYCYYYCISGSFPTCDLCNNANDLLISKELRFSPDQIDVILMFRKLHHKQQSNERAQQEEDLQNVKY